MMRSKELKTSRLVLMLILPMILSTHIRIGLSFSLLSRERRKRGDGAAGDIEDQLPLALPLTRIIPPLTLLHLTLVLQVLQV